MAKKNLGSKLALYPTPVTVVGAMTDEGPNWMLIAHVGIIGHDRVTISCAKQHYTNQWISRSGVCSVNLIDEKLLRTTDYVGSVSGAKEDKSNAFAWSAADNGAPLIDGSPLSLACSLEDVYETEGFDTFVLSIDGTYMDEDCLDERGRIDYGKVAPVLFEFPTYSYWSLGERIGGCLRLDKE